MSDVRVVGGKRAGGLYNRNMIGRKMLEDVEGTNGRNGAGKCIEHIVRTNVDEFL